MSKTAFAARLQAAWPPGERAEAAASAAASKRLELMAALPAGGLAGAVSWAVALPADVVKSNIQGAPLDTPKPALRVHAVALRIWRKDGLRGFFRGFVPCVLRSLPVNAATFFLLECLRDLKASY